MLFLYCISSLSNFTVEEELLVEYKFLKLFVIKNDYFEGSS
jgi:hypothetical protein